MPLELKGKVRPGEADRRYYMIRVQVNGRRVVVSSGTRNKQDATTKESIVIAALRANPTMSQADVVSLVTPKDSPRYKAAVVRENGMTLREGFNRCLEAQEHWGGIKSKDQYTRAANSLCELLGDELPLAAIDNTTLSRLVKNLTEPKSVRRAGKDNHRSGGTVNFYLAVLRGMFNIVAVKNWPGAPTAFPKVPSVPKRDQREYYLTPEDETALLDALDEWDRMPTTVPEGRRRKRDGHLYRGLFLALLEAGMRVREGLNIRWGDVKLPPEGTPYTDEFQGAITLYRSEDLKRGKRRVVPMTPTLRRLMESLKGKPVGPFAHLTYRRAHTLWSRAREAAGITDKDCVIHCTRHSCASRLLEAGVGIFEVKEWLGHSNIETTARYLHLSQRQLAGAAAKMGKLRRGPQ